mmetsp:Transcript_21850/g.69759  ORF Transcript_21850/g.69759 Transcript_21850/m.69759 type:complete len:261 (-) Transcript_21850:65-847(-)|eukprot:CAMPEP_0185443028 /NCGR_PEP_ID=MMETSP1365-20130426/46277_1 /TAXON_ID=38817 /ORGANISM="Gephyrocapsa oceanica, Strain RCC1303" /LENGTH=260 /DNA_ID=CAMNT_0028048607 /DNA_START=17 /DNA_END=799 /DNA_ORIENTATION=-
MSFSMEGKVVLVTGGSKGIGKGIARVFARAGAAVLLCSRNLAEGEAAAAELSESCAAKVSAVAADVTSLEDMQAVATCATERYGGLDVLCANAGGFPQTKIEDLTSEEWDAVMATNLKGSFLAVKACLPLLKLSSQPRVVLTSSITGPITGYPGWSHYGASKAGQLGFMRSAAIELAKYKVTVNSVLPGNIKTEGLVALGQEYLDGMAAAVPLGSIGEVEDIGHACLYFASAAAAYVTGQTIVVDGGQVLPESAEFKSEW